MYVCMYVYMHVCMYVCMHVCTSTQATFYSIKPNRFQQDGFIHVSSPVLSIHTHGVDHWFHICPATRAYVESMTTQTNVRITKTVDYGMHYNGTICT